MIARGTSGVEAVPCYAPGAPPAWVGLISNLVDNFLDAGSDVTYASNT